MAGLGLIPAARRPPLGRAFRRLLMSAGVVGLTISARDLIASELAWRRERAILAAALEPTHYRAAAPDLVRLCQTDPALLPNDGQDVDPDRVPSIGNLRPKAGPILVQPDAASVAWTDGAFHAAWHLNRLTDQGFNAASHTWTLSSTYDGEDGQLLYTFTMPADARFTAMELAVPSTRPARP